MYKSTILVFVLLFIFYVNNIKKKEYFKIKYNIFSHYNNIINQYKNKFDKYVHNKKKNLKKINNKGKNYIKKNKILKKKINKIDSLTKKTVKKMNNNIKISRNKVFDTLKVLKGKSTEDAFNLYDKLLIDKKKIYKEFKKGRKLESINAKTAKKLEKTSDKIDNNRNKFFIKKEIAKKKIRKAKIKIADRLNLKKEKLIKDEIKYRKIIGKSPISKKKLNKKLNNQLIKISKNASSQLQNKISPLQNKKLQKLFNMQKNEKNIHKKIIIHKLYIKLYNKLSNKNKPSHIEHFGFFNILQRVKQMTKIKHLMKEELLHAEKKLKKENAKIKKKENAAVAAFYAKHKQNKIKFAYAAKDVKTSKKEDKRLAKLSHAQQEGEKQSIMKRIINTFMFITLDDLNELVPNMSGCPINFDNVVKFIKNKLGEWVMRIIIPTPIYFYIKWKTGGKSIFVIVRKRIEKIYKSMKKKIDALINGLKSLPDIIKTEVINQLVNFINKIKVQMNDMIDIKGFVQDIKLKIKEKIAYFKERMKKEFSSNKEMLKEMYSTFKKQLNGLRKFLLNLHKYISKLIFERLTLLLGPFKPIYDFFKEYSYLINIGSIILLIYGLWPHIMQIYNKFRM